MQLDIGFGDIVVPSAPLSVFPAMLDFPAPRLRGYSQESTIAEKFEAMVRLGVLNSRMKDFFDIWTLCCQFDFAGEQLQKAIARTFENRGTPIPESTQLLLSEIAGDENKSIQWSAFLRKSGMAEIPGFAAIAERIAEFLHPVTAAIKSREQFTSLWKAPGPWCPEA